MRKENTWQFRRRHLMRMHIFALFHCNITVFEKDVKKFVVNEVRKEELIGFAESIISSVQQE